jgi:hypothetical protein
LFLSYFFLVFVVPLYSRPKVELSLSNVHPAYHEWYKRYDFNLTVNPSSRFGLRFKFGGMDFEYKEFAINNALYGGIKGLLYFPYNNVSPYVFLRLSASYDGATGYEEYSHYYLYSAVGLGVDWYFFDRLACFVEIDDFLRFYFSEYYGETTANFDGNPGIIFGLKFGIY